MQWHLKIFGFFSSIFFEYKYQYRYSADINHSDHESKINFYYFNYICPYIWLVISDKYMV